MHSTAIVERARYLVGMRALNPFLGLLITAAACTPPAPGVPVPATAECVVVDESARPRVDVGVIRPGESDRFEVDVAAAQVYETLVRVDCTGGVIAGLAADWAGEGRTWRFDIRRGASFTDGTPVNARTLAAALSTLPAFGAVVAAGEYDLRITLQREADVRIFARRELAVQRTGGAGRLSGTGRYEPAFDARSRVLHLIARNSAERPHAVRTQKSAPDTIMVRTFGRDLRAAVDAEVDVLVTNDIPTIEYARARSGYIVAPLTWSRTYVLATAAGGHSVGAVPSTAFPTALVGATARPALPPFWWSACESSFQARTADSADAARAAGTDGRILFLRTDPVARSIAERITALARGRAPEWLASRLSNDAPPVAAGVDEADLVEALRTRKPLAIVAMLPRVEHGGCAASATEPYFMLLSEWRVTPLVETRDDLVYRAGIGHVTVDADGTLQFGRR